LGFSVAVLLVGWAVAFFGVSFTETSNTHTEQGEAASFIDKAHWRELPVSEKIERMLGVALLRFEEQEDKLMAARVEKIVVINNAANIPLNVGDRVEKADYYAAEGFSRNRDGVLLMYAGSPAKEMEGAYLYESRLIAYGDMPLEVFFKKLEEAKSK